MTREEAIKELENMKKFNYTLAPLEVFDMAIKALWAVEHMPTTKNDLGVDCISRAEAIKCLECDFDITGKENMKTVVNYINSAHDKIVNLPRVKQEPFKPMVEIDLYSVIKQKYIEREVLDEIRAEIERLQKMCDKNDLNLMAQYSAFGMVLDILDKYKAETEGKE